MPNGSNDQPVQKESSNNLAELCEATSLPELRLTSVSQQMMATQPSKASSNILLYL